MSISITWSIAELERTTSDGIVYTAHYRVNATDGVYQAGGYGSVGFPAPEEGDVVIPFADLTEALVVEWVKAALGEETVEQTETALQAQIAEQAAPTTAKGTPW